MCGAHYHKTLGWKAKGIETGAMRCAAFNERHVLGDPAQTFSFTAERGQPEGKSGGGGAMSFAERRNFVQRAAHEPAAQNRIDGGNR